MWQSPATTAPAPLALWVAEVGVCDRCDGLTIRGTCQTCETERRRDQVVDQAQLRPFLVVVARQGEDYTPSSQDTAVLVLPDTVSESAHQVAEAVTTIANDRLISGDTLDFALFKIAAGRDQIKRDLARLGITMSRQTVRRAIEELMKLGVIERAGQLDGWVDTKAENDGPLWKVGAYIYSLNITFRKLGDRALKALRKGASRLARAFDPSTATVRTTGHGNRIDGALKWALRWAHEGNRNALGHWLTCRCTDVGLTEGQAMKVLETYRANVADNQDGHRYTLREAQGTVRSRYRRKVVR